MSRESIWPLGAVAALGAIWAYNRRLNMGVESDFKAAMLPAEELAVAQGWPRGVITAWAALESDWGKSKLSLPPNFNLFGIKTGSSWTGPKVTYLTGEYLPKMGADGKPEKGPDGKPVLAYVKVPADFRAYPGGYADSVRDLFVFLKGKGRYAPTVAALGKGDFPAFKAAITASGYSTAANYGDRIAARLTQVQNTA